MSLASREPITPSDDHGIDANELATKMQLLDTDVCVIKEPHTSKIMLAWLLAQSLYPICVRFCKKLPPSRHDH